MMDMDELQRRINGFRESRALLTAIELDLFTAVGGGAGAAAVAGELGTDPRATEALLNAVAAMGALEKEGGVFRNTETTRSHLAAGGEHDSRAALMHAVHLWPRWSTLTECVREGTSVLRRTGAGRDAEWTEAFIAAMHRNAAGRAPRVVAAIGVEGVRRVLDVGGGSGAYAIAFAQAEPGLAADILDVPDVVPIAQRHIDEAGLGARVRPRPGDFRTDDLGRDYDLVFLSAICHMNGPDENRRLLGQAFEALAPRGRVVIQDFILEPDKTAPEVGALFALNMLVGTRSGSSYSEPEYAEWLRDAGFVEVRRVPLSGPTDLMVGQRP